MAGTIRGRIDCLTSAAGGTTTIQGGRNVQAIFNTIWAFLDAHPNLTRISSYYGDAANHANIAAPTNVRGVGYWDEATNFGTNAFGVWRFNNAAWPWFLMIEFSSATGATLLNSSRMHATTTDSGLFVIGISAAWGKTGGGAAATTGVWGGGTANAGADARATTRWTDPGGGIYVLPRSNNLYGTDATNRNNSTRLVTLSTGSGSPIAFNMWADDDSFMIAHDYGNANTWNASGVFRYVPRAGLTVARPYAMIVDTDGGTAQLPWFALSGNTANVFGGTAGNSANEGGAIMPDGIPAGPVRPIGLERYQVQSSTSFEPTSIDGTASYNEFSIPIWACAPSETTSAMGHLGKLDPVFVREVYNVSSADTNVAQTKAIFGGANALTNIKLVMPWDGVTTPRTYAGATDAIKRVGVAF